MNTNEFCICRIAEEIQPEDTAKFVLKVFMVIQMKVKDVFHALVQQHHIILLEVVKKKIHIRFGVFVKKVIGVENVKNVVWGIIEIHLLDLVNLVIVMYMVGLVRSVIKLRVNVIVSRDLMGLIVQNVKLIDMFLITTDVFVSIIPQKRF